MPSSLVRSYAKKSGKSVKAVEAKWKEAKKLAGKSYDPDTNPDAYWGTVNKITKRKLKLGESVMRENLDTLDLKKFNTVYSAIYNTLYDLGERADYSKEVELMDKVMQDVGSSFDRKLQNLLKRYYEEYHDTFTSDREIASLYFALSSYFGLF